MKKKQKLKQENECKCHPRQKKINYIARGVHKGRDIEYAVTECIGCGKTTIENL